MNESIIDKLENGKYKIVLDTNVLLMLYRYSPDYAKYCIDCLEKIKKNIVIPSIVKCEYEFHRRSKHKNAKNIIKELNTSLETILSNTKSKVVKACNIYKNLKYPNINEMEKELNKEFDRIQSFVSNSTIKRKDIKNASIIWETDIVEQFVNQCEVSKEYTEKEIYFLCKVGAERFEEKIPPGYKDSNKKGIFGYFDFLIWASTIRYSLENDFNIIFVTNDLKSDWWKIDKEKKTFRDDLIKEFQIKTNKSIIGIDSSELFFCLSKEISVEHKDIEEFGNIMLDNYIYERISDEVFSEISEELETNTSFYIDGSKTNNLGDEGILSSEISNIEEFGCERVDETDDYYTYYLYYDVTIDTVSKDYWGKDEDTKQPLYSPDIDVSFSGDVVVSVNINISSFYKEQHIQACDVKIVEASLSQSSYYDHFEYDIDDMYD